LKFALRLTLARVVATTLKATAHAAEDVEKLKWKANAALKMPEVVDKLASPGERGRNQWPLRHRDFLSHLANQDSTYSILPMH
jgi:hypothetical protein